MKLQDQHEVYIYIKKLQEMLPELKKKYPIKYMGVFGSYVQGEQRPSSDMDILVEFSEVPGIFGFLRLERYLSEILGRKVDLVEKSALKPRIGRRVQKEVLYI